MRYKAPYECLIYSSCNLTTIVVIIITIMIKITMTIIIIIIAITTLMIIVNVIASDRLLFALRRHTRRHLGRLHGSGERHQEIEDRATQIRERIVHGDQ